MTMTEEIRKTLSDPKPLYALAGAGDLAAEKLRDAPILLTEAAGAVTTLATRIATEAPERLAKVQARITEVQGSIDPRAVAAGLDPRTARESIRGAVSGAVGKVDAQALRQRAQSIALGQVGRVLEAAGKAVDTYGELAERGKTVIDRYRGSGDEDEPSDVTVIVEQVVVDEPETQTDAAPGGGESKIEDAVVEESAADADEGAKATASAKPQAKKTTSTPRKRAASSAKTTPSAKTAESSKSSTASKNAEA